jgi:ABC-type sugar transport system ATPase subunit
MARVHLDHVTKRFASDRPPATDRLSFTLESGRISPCSGLRAAEKTTTLRLIAGFETPDEGHIAIAGHDCLGRLSGHRVHSSQPSSATFPIGLRVRPRAHALHVVTFRAP